MHLLTKRNSIFSIRKGGDKIKELVQLINKLEVISDTITATLDFYIKIEESSNVATDSNKLKIFINHTNEKLIKLINDLWIFVNK